MSLLNFITLLIIWIDIKMVIISICLNFDDNAHSNLLILKLLDKFLKTTK